MAQVDTYTDFDHWDHYSDYDDWGMDYRPEEPDDSDVPEGLLFAGSRMDNDTFYGIEDSEDYKKWEAEQEQAYARFLEQVEADELAAEEDAWAVEQGFVRRDASAHRLGQFGTHRVFVMQGDEDLTLEHAKMKSAAAHKPRDKK